jgi:hypothetical protein
MLEEGGGSTFLRNVTELPGHTASHPRRYWAYFSFQIVSKFKHPGTTQTNDVLEVMRRIE